jgi:ligand-binding sensor domain-containing protein
MLKHTFYTHFRQTIIIPSIIIVCCVFASAQVYKHRVFNTSDGLSSTTIYHAVQDGSGYIWLASDAGVTKFDGAHFHAYYKNDGLMDNDIIHLIKGNKGAVGLLTYNGHFSIYDKGTIYNSTNTKWLAKAAFDNPVIAGFQDTKGAFWLGTKDGNVYCLRPDTVFNFGKKTPIIPQNSSFITPKSGSAAHFFYQDTKNDIWIDGCYKIENGAVVRKPNHFEFEQSSAFFHQPNTKNEVLFLAKEGIIRWRNDTQTLVLPRKLMADIGDKQYGYILEDREQNIWIPTIGNGVYQYRRDKNGAWQPPLRYLSNAKISTALQDHEGNIWFCLLGEGLYMLPSNYKSAITYNRQNNLDYDRIDAVLADKNGNIWCGMDDATLNIIPPVGDIQALSIDFEQKKDRAYQNVLHLQEDAKGRIWAMTPSRIVFYTPKTNRSDNRQWQQTTIQNPEKLSFKSWTFMPDGRIALAYSRGIAWLTEQNGKWTIKTETQIPHKITYSVFADTKGQIWVANIDGLNRFYQNKFQNWAKYNPLFKEKIKSMAELPDKTLVLAAEGYGLLLLKDSVLLEQFSLKNEFENNIFKQLQVRDSTIWCTGNHGLARILYRAKKLGHVSTYRTSEGLASDEVIDIFVTQWEAMAATAKGLTILEVNSNDGVLPAPQVFILNKNENNSFINTNLYPNNTASIIFEAVALREPNTVQYRYRFNSTQDWQYATHSNNTVSLAQLQAGSYRFEVQARHLNSAWSKSDTINFKIYPFWWQTTWFWLFCTTVILGSVGFFALRYTQKQQKRQTERLQAEKKMTELEQQALQSMMNPHFVFNVMNSVQYFLNHNNKESANRYLTQFARMLRTNLEYSNKQTINLDEEIKYLNLYLSLEKLRCGDTLNYVFNIDEDLDTACITLPPMLLQPYIENAIWHGIMPNKENYDENGGIITIEVTEPQPDVLQITISDDGVGIDNSKAAKAESPSNHHSLALTLTAERLRILSELTQKTYSVTMRQINTKGGTEVTLLLAIL